ncbi:MAG: class I SAM-dependent methyltransferase [Chthoniobacterales bacterium]
MKSANDAAPSPPWEDNPVSIKYWVKRFIQANQSRFENKVVIDTPAGSGITAQILQKAGATVHAYDLFPEYFKAQGMVCERANIMEGLPAPDDFADFLICQEGIEHLSDQYRALKEFNRVLKPGGSLIITTPNYSNLMARMSYFLFEAEYLFKKMPPNEIDSVWMNDDGTDEIYLGHYFLLGIQRLRGLAKLSGFRLKQIVFTHVNTTSLVIFPFAYPFVRLAGWLTYRQYLRRFRRNKNYPPGSRRSLLPEGESVYRELMKLNTDWRILLDKNLFVEFEKETDLKSAKSAWRSQHKSFDIIP